MHIALFDLDFGAHRLQALDVLVNRARADCTATGQGDTGFAAACDKRTEHEDGSTHGLDHLVGSDRVVQAAAIEHQTVNPIDGDTDTHVAKQAQHGRNIVEMRHIGEVHRFRSEQRRAENRQSRILGTRNRNFTGKGIAALNQ